MATNFHLAPPAKMVDGLLAVPIDISAISATFRFDGATQSATADATITYEVGPTAGHPIFDLRQTPSQAWLDGAVFPVGQLAHHTFGTGNFTDLRVIDAMQAAGSVHTLRVQYPLALPNAQLGGSYLPALDWSAGPRLRFVFGLSDLNRARYVEAWLPANLLFDQYAITLELEIVNTMAAHSVITNGTVTPMGTNHWQIAFPARFTALSPMLEVRASDTLQQHSGSVVLPVSGTTVTLETWKPSSSAVDLPAQVTALGALLSANETGYGPYGHGNRYVAFFNGSGGMEYEGGTTSSTGALAHEVFHSWYARGIKPASQDDGWWDEAFTSFHDDGADDPEAFDFSDPPILLCARDPWQRHTISNAYGDGSRFWRGMTSLLGAPTVNALMAQLYQTYAGKPVSTQNIEEFLLSRNGNPMIVDAFHRFVYGLADPSPAPDLWLRDAPGDPGADAWGDTFWDSPDLWIRRQDDGGTAHQSPEFGQDNWFHARVRNKSGTGTARHFVVTFHAKGFAGTQFSYPGDFLPSMAARAEFELAPGATRVVKARWPAALVPPAKSHTCLLASVITRGEHPVAGRHVWEDNSLAQKNLTVVDLVPGEFIIFPVVLSAHVLAWAGLSDIEVWRERGAGALEVSLIHDSRDFFARVKGAEVRPFKPDIVVAPRADEFELECGGHVSARGGADKGRMVTSATPDLVAERYGKAWQLMLDAKPRVRVPVEIPLLSQRRVAWMVQVGREMKPGEVHRLHLVQRHKKSGMVAGGVALEIRVGRISGRGTQEPGSHQTSA